MDWNRLMLIMQILGSLVLIGLLLVLTYFASRWYARRMRGSVSGKYMKIIDRTITGTGTSLLIVQVGSQYYLLGSSEKNLQLICELTDFDPEAALPETQPASFGSLLHEFMEKTKQAGGKKNGDA